MIKIKENLFEHIVGCVFLPNVGIIITTALLILSLIVKQQEIEYRAFVISYGVCLAVLASSIILCLLLSKKEVIFSEDKLIFQGCSYYLKDIDSCEYYVCKWYVIPIAIIYKKQIAGLLNIKLNNGKKICFKIFYKDYLKIKNIIGDIEKK